MKGMLSNREFEIFMLVCTGISNKEAADKVFITVKTIKFHLTNIYKKLEVKSRAEMSAKYYQRKLPLELLEKIKAFESKYQGFITPIPVPDEDRTPAPIEDQGLPRGVDSQG